MDYYCAIYYIRQGGWQGRSQGGWQGGWQGVFFFKAECHANVSVLVLSSTCKQWVKLTAFSPVPIMYLAYASLQRTCSTTQNSLKKFVAQVYCLRSLRHVDTCLYGEQYICRVCLIPSKVCTVAYRSYNKY